VGRAAAEQLSVPAFEAEYDCGRRHAPGLLPSAHHSVPFSYCIAESPPDALRIAVEILNLERVYIYLHGNQAILG
jgi:hypothetical protein